MPIWRSQAIAAIAARGRLVGMLAIRSARLFDGMADQLRARPLVLVDGGRITDVDFTGADPPEGATLVDLGEATLLPGLIDSHTHLVLDASSDPVGHLAGVDDNQLLEQCRARARAALAAGITTLRDLGDRRFITLQLREELAAHPERAPSYWCPARRSPPRAGTAGSLAARPPASRGCGGRCGRWPPAGLTWSR
jgi:imidazolonepropionase-like amidohydrolase